MEIVPTEMTIVLKCVYTGNSGISLMGENGCSLGDGGKCNEHQSLPNMKGNYSLGNGRKLWGRVGRCASRSFMFLDGVPKFIGATFSKVEGTQEARGWTLP
jgi:hypothetical protein